VARLFVAVWPPAPLIEELRQLDRIVRPGLRWTTEDQWHVTMRFLGEISATEQETAGAALNAVAAASGPVAATAGPTPRRLGSGVWALPVDGLDGLAGRVEAATGGIGRSPRGRRPFHGHLTLARGRAPAALAGLAQPRVAARWAVEELTLVRSELHPAGARYQVMGRWALGPPAAGDAAGPAPTRCPS
jgi:2'-5' RNA ligase